MSAGLAALAGNDPAWQRRAVARSAVSQVALAVEPTGTPGTPRRYCVKRRRGPFALPVTPYEPSDLSVDSGWRNRAQVPPARKATYAPREGRACASSTWGPRHAARVGVVATLLNAGHVARRWECDAERYTSGPCEGLRVVDPWIVAGRIGDCCSDVVIHATAGGTQGAVSVSPERCGAKHVCPVCAAAAATKRAEAIRVVAARAGRPGLLVSVVLTHRDRPPGAETCREAWERWESAYERLRTGKNGEWLRTRVYGGCLCLETTGGATGASWHPHGHAILELCEGVHLDTFRDELAAMWARCTELAGRPSESLFSGLTDTIRGWDRAAGFSDDGRERWCELVAVPTPLGTPLSDGVIADIRSAAYQVAKYPSPIADLADPARMAEFVTWAHGRHLTRWLGSWGKATGTDDNGLPFVADTQEWIAAAVKVEAEEARKRRVFAGDAPDTGPILPGYRPATGRDVAKAEPSLYLKPGEGTGEDGERWEEDTAVPFLDASGTAPPIRRYVSDIETIRAWWRMAGIQHRLGPVLTEIMAEGPRMELLQRFRALRKRPDVRAALAEWEALRAAETLTHWTDDALNGWYADRERNRREVRNG